MNSSKPEQDLQARLSQAEGALDALRNNEVDAVVGSEDVHLLRLKDFEDQHPSLLENLPDVVFRLDRKLRHLYVSPVVKLLTGMEPAHFLHKTAVEAGYPQEQWPLFEAACLEVLHEGAPRQLGFYFETPHGTRFLQARLFPEKDENGEVRFILGITTDLTEQRKAQTALQASEERLAAVIEGADLGTWERCSTSGICTHWNERMKELFGFDGEPEDGIDALCIRAHPEDKSELLRMLQHAWEDQRLDHTYRIILPDGSIRWIRLVGRLTRKNDDPEARLVGIADDVTAREVAEQRLARAKDAAVRADRSKSDFLANLSHEIRTPMTVILGYAEVLRQKIADEFLGQCINGIKDSGNLLVTIINDVLDLSKIEAGKFALRPRIVSPRGLIEEVVSVMHGSAREKGLSLNYYLDGDLPTEIETDPDRIKQILINLLSNAIKFTERGRVDVHASYSSDSHVLRIAIADTGIGVSPEFQQRIFQPFEQAPAPSETFQGGTGLGLAICQRLSELLGGSIELESSGESGSIFTLILPVQDMTDAERVTPPSAASKDRSPTPQLAGAQILVVDDQRAVRHILDHILQNLGCSTLLASSGTEALDIVARSGDALDLVLLDMRLPEMDGYEIARRLRARGFTQPIIAITAHAMESHRETCLEAGCTDFLAKPIDHDALLETLVRHVKPRR